MPLDGLRYPKRQPPQLLPAGAFELDRAHPLTAGMFGFWPLRGDAKNYFTGSNGSLVGSTATVMSPRGPGFKNTTSGQCINTGTPITSLVTGSGSVSCWVSQTIAYNAGGPWRFLFGASPSDWGCQIYIDNNWYLGSNSGASRIIFAASATNAPTNTWTHYVYTWTTTTHVFYQNGAVIGSAGSPGNPGSITGNLAFGAEGTGAGNPLLGSINGCGVWNRALSAREVMDLYVEPFALLRPVSRRIGSMSSGPQSYNATANIIGVGSVAAAPSGPVYATANITSVSSLTEIVSVPTFTVIQRQSRGSYTPVYVNTTGEAARLSRSIYIENAPAPPPSGFQFIGVAGIGSIGAIKHTGFARMYFTRQIYDNLDNPNTALYDALAGTSIAASFTTPGQAPVQGKQNYIINPRADGASIPSTTWGDAGTQIVKSNANLDANNPVSSWSSVRANTPHTTGKWYCEIQAIQVSSSMVFGVADDSTSAGSGLDVTSPTVLLVHADWDGVSITNFYDSSLSAHALTSSNSAYTATGQHKFGNASAGFPASNSYIDTGNATDFNFGSGQFTVEAWVYFTATPTADSFVVSQWNQITYDQLSWGLSYTGTYLYLVYSVDGAAGGVKFVYTLYTAPLNTWMHFAADRDASNVIRVYVNGAVVASATVTDTIYPSPLTAMIGNDHGLSNPFKGYLDEIRVTKGLARYGGAFTAPTAPFAVDVSTFQSGGVSSDGTSYLNGFTAGTTDAIGSIGLIRLAIDLDNQELYIGNGATWIGTSNPATRTNPRITWYGKTGINICPWVALGGNATVRILPTAPNWSNAAPAGYKAWEPIPTGWYNILPPYGMGFQTLGTGIENGIPYLEMRLFGIPQYDDYLRIEPGSFAGVVEGDTWWSSFYIRISGGSTAGVDRWSADILYSSLTAEVGFASFTVASLTQSGGLSTRYSTGGLVSAPPTNTIIPTTLLHVLGGQAVDITLRFGGPQLEKDTVVTGLILPPAGSPGVSTRTNTTNYITNPRAEGAVAGTPGTIPTGWGGITAGNGIQVQIVGNGTERGIQYIEIRFFGTASASTNCRIIPMSLGPSGARNGETWLFSFNMRISSGSATNISFMQSYMSAYDATSSPLGFVGNFATFSVNSLTQPGNARYYSVGGLISGMPTVDSVLPFINFLVGNGLSVDCTLRFSGPQLERNNYPTALVLPPTGSPGVSTGKSNFVTNPRAEGATPGIVGSGGILPIDWGITGGASTTFQIIGTGTENGIPYLEFRLFGTPSATSTFLLLLMSYGYVKAQVGETWRLSCYMRLTAGSMTNVANVFPYLDAYDADANRISAIDATLNYISLPSLIQPGGLSTRYAGGGLIDVIMNPTLLTTASVTPCVAFQVTSGQAVDFTVRVGGIQLEQNEISALILPPVGARGVSTRADPIQTPISISEVWLLLELP